MIETIITLGLNNFLSPVILFFILGFGAKLLRSDLEIPGNVSKFIAIYLMMAIGYKGGYALSQSDLSLHIISVLGLGILFSALIPVISFYILGAIGVKSATQRGVIAAHYGSVSVVTFVTATELLRTMNIEYDSWMVAVMASMETPALFAGLLLINLNARDKGNRVKMDSKVWREIFLNGSVVVLVGSFFIGWLSGEKGMMTVSPFFVDIFKGVLCLFMIDIGMVAASKIAAGQKNLSIRLVAFGILMPMIGAVLGGFSASLLGLGVGSVMLFSVLCASASYIAVPAALRIALPKADLSPSITLSLAVTFPFNIIVGLPIYFWMAEMMSKI